MKTITSSIILIASITLPSTAATSFWTQSFDPGSRAHNPGEQTGTEAVDTAIVTYNRNSTAPAGELRGSHAEGLFDNAGTEDFSGRGFAISEDNSVSGTASAVFSQNFNLAAEGDSLRLTQAFAWGHMARSGTGWTEDNQVFQFGLLNLAGGSSENRFFDGATDGLYLSFVATSATSRRFNDATTGTPGSHTGNLTLRNQNGTLATIASNITFDSNLYLGGTIGNNSFTTQTFWYDFDLNLTRGANNSLTVDVDIAQYSTLSDIDWSTQSTNPNGIDLENANFHTSSTTLTSTQHDLGNLSTIDLNPTIGVNIIDSFNSGASGLTFDSNSVIAAVPEPSTLTFSGVSLLLALSYRKRKHN